MVDSDKDIYRRRAFQERVAAVACEDNRAALAHLELADLYEDRFKRASGADDRTAVGNGAGPTLLPSAAAPFGT